MNFLIWLTGFSLGLIFLLSEKTKTKWIVGSLFVIGIIAEFYFRGA